MPVLIVCINHLNRSFCLPLIQAAVLHFCSAVCRQAIRDGPVHVRSSIFGCFLRSALIAPIPWLRGSWFVFRQNRWLSLSTCSSWHRRSSIQAFWMWINVLIRDVKDQSRIFFPPALMYFSRSTTLQIKELLLIAEALHSCLYGTSLSLSLCYRWEISNFFFCQRRWRPGWFL